MAEVKPRSYWAELVAEFENSSQEHKVFASEKGVNLWTFQGWLYRMRREKKASKRRVRLLPVRVTAARAGDDPAPSIVEMAAAGVVLRFDRGADIGFVVKLISELERRGC